MRLLIILSIVMVTMSQATGQERALLPGGREAKRVQINTGIEQVISGFSELAGSNPAGMQERLFLGTFEFESLPEPLTPVRVDFTLVAQQTHPWAMEQDWEIRLQYDAHHMGMSGDTAMTWPGPHMVGEAMTGSFEVVPYSTGLHFIELVPKLNSGMGMEFGWHLDLDGNLTYLGKWKDYPRSGTVGCCAFFAEDSVILRGINRRPIGHSMFDYTYSVVPPFKIGEPSRVTYRLVAVKDAPDGIDISLRTECMQIVGFPEQVSNPLSVGDTLTIDISVIPMAVNAVHEIVLDVENGITSKPLGGYNVILCDAVLRNDSTLWIIANGQIHPTEDHLVADAFRRTQDGDREKYRVFKDRKGIEHKKY